MAARDCCCIFTTRFTFPGNMAKPGSWGVREKHNPTTEDTAITEEIRSVSSVCFCAFCGYVLLSFILTNSTICGVTYSGGEMRNRGLSATGFMEMSRHANSCA